MSEPLEGAIHADSHLYWWNTAASPPAYQEIDETFEIQGLRTQRQEVPRTPISSTAVRRMAGLTDGETVTINLNRTTVNSALIRTWDASAGVDYMLVASPALDSEALYFRLVPLGKDYGTIKAENPAEAIFQGRIDGDIETTDPHAP
jgi:hypothetical protein